MYETDYYGHHATTTLARPVAIAGFIGAGVPAIARAVSAQTGIPFINLSRWVEHARGKSIANLVLHDGECALRSAEEEGLARGLQGAPPPIIALGHGALLSPKSRALLRDRDAILMYLQAPLGVLADRARAQIARARTKHYPYFTEHSDGAADLEALFSARLPGYLDAQVTVSIAELSTLEASHAIMKHLPVAAT